MPVKVLQFFSHPLHARFGGPYTYLYNLKSQIDKNNEIEIIFLSDLLKQVPNKHLSHPNQSFVKKIIKPFIPARIMFNRRVVNYLSEIKKTLHPDISAIDFSGFDIIHFHESIDLWRYGHLLNNYKGKIVFTSHCPVPCHLEMLQEVFGINRGAISKNVYRKLEETDRNAFSLAQQFIFPCKESLEAYHQWQPFDRLIKNKPVYFLPTGVPAAAVKKTKAEILKECEIPQNGFIISYTGRHLKVKGYDLLEKVAEIILKKYSDIYFIVAGKKSGIETFHHPHWIETGWTNDPYSFINAADAHIIPNRETYFDLNTLEAMSLSKTIILTDTGGNKFFRENIHSPGFIFAKAEAEDLALKIEQLYQQKHSLESLGKENYIAYKKYFTAEIFYKNYMELYQKIKTDG